MIIEKEQTSCVRLYNDADFKNLKKKIKFFSILDNICEPSSMIISKDIIFFL